MLMTWPFLSQTGGVCEGGSLGTLRKPVTSLHFSGVTVAPVTESSRAPSRANSSLSVVYFRIQAKPQA